jgi:hypothetical protein
MHHLNDCGATIKPGSQDTRGAVTVERTELYEEPYTDMPLEEQRLRIWRVFKLEIAKSDVRARIRYRGHYNGRMATLLALSENIKSTRGGQGLILKHLILNGLVLSYIDKPCPTEPPAAPQLRDSEYKNAYKNLGQAMDPKSELQIALQSTTIKGFRGLFLS